MVKSCASSHGDNEFQGKDVNEEFQFCFHQHWIRMLWPTTRLILFNSIIFGIGYITLILMKIPDPNTRRLFLITMSLLLFVSHAEFLMCFYRYFLYIIIITDKKVHRIKKTLLAIDDHQSVDLWMLQDIYKCQHGIIQNFLRYGSLILEAQDTVVRIHFVPNIAKRYGHLIQMRETARMNVANAARDNANKYIDRIPLESFYPTEITSPSRKEALYWQYVRDKEQRRLATKSP